MEEALRRIGLLDNEIKIYLTLLKMGSALASELAEKTDFHRVYVYDVLKSLTNKGLVTYVIKNNKKYFDVISPNKILDLLKEKEDEIKKQEQEIQKILPQLLLLHKPRKNRPIVEVYEGKEGMKTIFNDILRTKKEWLTIGGTGHVPKVLPYFIPGWHLKRKKAKIKARAIFYDTKNGRKRGKEFLNIGLAEVKHMPKEYVLPATIYLWENKTAIVLISEEKPYGILIESKEITKSFKAYFELVWRMSY